MGSVAENVLQHGTGGLNIDVSRVGTPEDKAKSNRFGHSVKDSPVHVFGPRRMHAEPDGKGRWPSNVILEHRGECRQVGTKKVKGGNDPRRGDGSKSGHNFHSFNLKKKHDRRPCDHEGFSDKDGLEEIPAWECEPGCPVAALDDQASAGGLGRSAGDYPSDSCGTGAGHTYLPKKPQGKLYADEGGASRFFKQVKRDE